MPPIQNSVISNPRWYLPRVSGTAEKAIVHVQIGDSNSTPSNGAQGGGAQTDWNTWYHSLYVEMLKLWPYPKLGGMRMPVHLGNNPALFGQVAGPEVTPGATAAIVSHFRYVSPTPYAPQPNDVIVNSVNTIVFASDQIADNRFLWTIRGSEWCADSDWYRDGSALEALIMTRRTNDGCTTTLWRAERGGVETGLLEGALASPVSNTAAANFFNASSDWVVSGVSFPTGTQAAARVALIGTAADETNKRATFSSPFVRRVTPSYDAPEFDSVAVGGFGLPQFAVPEGYTGNANGFTDLSIRDYIKMMVRSLAGTRLDKEVVALIDLGTNRWGVSTQSNAESWLTTIIERWSTAAAAEQVPIHFVIKPPADPGTASLTQDTWFDMLDAAALAVAASLDSPNRRVMAISMRQSLLAYAPEYNGTLGGPYDASTNPNGGIVNEITDVHRNRIGAPRELGAMLASLNQYGALRTRNDVGCTTPLSKVNLRDKRPFMWVQYYGGEVTGGGSFIYYNGIRGDALGDIAAYNIAALNKTKQHGYKRIIFHVPGGKRSPQQQYYGADQWSLMPEDFQYWFANQMRNECSSRDIVPEVYLGAVWEPLMQSSPTGIYPPVLDVLSEDDLIEREVLPWVEAGCKVLWFDAVSVLSINPRTREFLNRLRDWLWHRGVVMGGEAYPTINSGGHQIDVARVYDMPYLTTESGHDGFNNVDNYTVPSDAAIFDVFEENLWNTTLGAQRKAQGFIGCPWYGMSDEQIGEIAALWPPVSIAKSRPKAFSRSRTMRAPRSRA